MIIASTILSQDITPSLRMVSAKSSSVQMNWFRGFEERETQQLSLFKYVSYTNSKREIIGKGRGCRQCASEDLAFGYIVNSLC